MATKLEVINFALSHLGQPPISSLTSGAAGAVQGNLWAEQARQEVLVAYPWIFATKRSRLRPKVLNQFERNQYLDEWFYSYMFPTDCLFIQYLVNPNTANQVFQATDTPFAVERNPSNVPNESERIVLANVQRVSAVYTFDMLDYEMMPPYFIQPMSKLLSAHMAYSVTSDLNLKNRMANEYLTTLISYTAQDANQHKNKRPQESEIIQSRESGLYDYGTPY